MDTGVFGHSAGSRFLGMALAPTYLHRGCAVIAGYVKLSHAARV